MTSTTPGGDEGKRRLSAEDVRVLARILRIDIPEERLQSTAEQVNGVYEGLERLNYPGLGDVEPATAFHLPWK